MIDITYDADHWKNQDQQSYRAELVIDEETGDVIGPPGAATLFASLNPKQHDVFGKHKTNEKQKAVRKPGKAVQTIWEVLGANHLLDCGAIARVVAHQAGFRVTGANVVKQKTSSWGKARGKGRKRERTRGRWR